MPAPLLALLLLAQRGDSPRILIAALAPAKKETALPNLAIADHLAEEFEGDGRTFPIVWGLTDAVFRPAALEGRLGNVPTLPTRLEALEVAKKLGASYVLFYHSNRKDGKLNASAELLIDGRTVWKDSKSMSASLGSKQSDQDTAASIARTWVQILNVEVLKGLTPKKIAVTPDPTPGQKPVIVETPVAPPVATGQNGLQARIDSLTKAGKPQAALALARDAVDADPLSASPRLSLIALLSFQGDVKGAAEESRKAAELMPEKTELRVEAIRRLIGVGKNKEAREQVNELIARRPEDKDARRLAAEVALADNDAAGAVLELEPLLRDGDDTRAHLLRGLARAQLGGADGAVADLKAWANGETDRTSDYLFAQQTLGRMAERAAAAMPALMQRAAVQPKSAAVRDDLDSFQRGAQARSAAWEAIAPPASLRAKHDDWSLAHRLMSLAAADLRAFIGGNDDAQTAARIDLGEAVRAMKIARAG
jgi:tetratricopeptide (TPR) repeat protein